MDWIGVRLTVQDPTMLRVNLTPDKTHAMLELLELLASEPVIAVSKLQHACGILGWLSSIIPVARPWMGMLYAVLMQAKQSSTSKRSTTRARKGQCFRKQLVHAVQWLRCLLQGKVEDQALRH